MEQRATQESIAARILAYSASFVDESLCATCLWMPSAPRGSAPEGRWGRCRSSTTPMLGELSCIVPLTTRLPLMTRGSQCYPPVSWTTQGPACRQRRGVDGYADQSTDMVLSRVHPGVRGSRAVLGLRLPGIPSVRAGVSTFRPCTAAGRALAASRACDTSGCPWPRDATTSAHVSAQA